MNALAKETPLHLQPDDLRDLLHSVAQTSERLEATHAALQKQVARLQGELAEANAQLQRSRALAALGEMAAGIAHEIRNPLGSIQLYVQVLAEEVRNHPEPSKLCEKIERAVVGLDAIVRDVLSFARNMTIQPRRVRAEKLFHSALAGCEALISESRCMIQSSIDPGCEFDADAGLMTQAISNVIRNAVEAMRLIGGGGSTRELRLEASTRAVRCPEGMQETRAVLVVEDDGPGIPPDIVKRMFNPFFTTRQAGTGLGLAIVHRIVDAHGGHIHVSQGRTRGARIEICLPLRLDDQRGRAQKATDSEPLS